MLENNIQCLVTHNGKFHADEITAIALLHLFNKIDLSVVQIIRTRKQSLIDQADIVLDVGNSYNEQVLRFDHHHIAIGRISCAGLVWAWIKKTNQADYPEINELIALIDGHDCGIEMMPHFSFAHIIASYNTDNPFSDELQFESFSQAINVALTLLSTLKKQREQRANTQSIIEQADIQTFKDKHILTLPQYCQGWEAFINGQTKYHYITHVIWYVEQQNEWYIQVPAAKEDSFILQNTKLLPDPCAEFVHQNGFLAIYKNKESIFNMLRE